MVDGIQCVGVKATALMLTSRSHTLNANHMAGLYVEVCGNFRSVWTEH